MARFRVYRFVNKVRRALQNVYCRDGLATPHNHDFMRDEAFCQAYARGVQASGMDYGWQWRVHIGLWAAFTASRLAGDFVECGVNKGFLSSAIMHYLNWDSLEKTYYLLDTFSGVDQRYLAEEEVAAGALRKNREYLEDGFYVQALNEVQANFSEWRQVCIIQGTIPETLQQVQAGQVAFLHLDMNCAVPEVAAFEYFWEFLVPGGMVLMDDYGLLGHEFQKQSLDGASRKRGVQIAALPTGQGLLVKT